MADTINDIKALQQQLKSEGLYDGEIDGVVGDDTRKAVAARDARQKAETDKANAAASQAQAEAAKAQAEAAMAQTQADAADRAAERDPVQQAFKVGVDVGLPIAGMAGGHLMANAVEAKAALALKARNTEVSRLGRMLLSKKTTPKARVAAATAAEKLMLGKTKGPMAAGIAGMMLVDGIVMREVVSKDMKDGSTKDLVRAGGVGLTMAGGTLLAERAISNATVKALPNATHLAAVEEAAATPKRVPRAAPVKRASGLFGRLGKVAGKVSKVALPVITGITAATAYSDAAAAGASGEDAAKEGFKAGADVLSGGAVSTFEKRQEEGRGYFESLASGLKSAVGSIGGPAIEMTQSGTVGIGAAVDALIEGKSTSEAWDALGQASMRASIQPLVDEATDAWAEKKAQEEAAAAQPSAGVSPSENMAPVPNEKMSDAESILPGVGVLAGGFIAEHALSKLPSVQRNGVGFGKYATVIAAGMAVGGYVTSKAAQYMFGEPTEDAKRSEPGKAYLNDAAAAKAHTAPDPAAGNGGSGRPPAAAPVRTDGMTEGYTRRDGARVTGYRTPKRK